MHIAGVYVTEELMYKRQTSSRYIIVEQRAGKVNVRSGRGKWMSSYVVVNLENVWKGPLTRTSVKGVRIVTNSECKGPSA